jgi:2-dehydro-3-deoxyglucarate aldolase
MGQSFRTALKDLKTTFGGWIQVGHPAVGEILAGAGFDWLAVDLEHGVIDLETMANIFRGIDGSGCTPIARLPQNDPIWIQRSLDVGAKGLIIPMVNTADEAERAIQFAKYPPRGQRGYGYCRANGYGREFNGYIRQANPEIAMIMQIEHRVGIENLEAILQVPDVDGVFIGPLDLSGSYGKAGDLECQEMRLAMERFLELCGRYHKAAGVHIVRPDETRVSRTIREGYNFIALGVDVVFLETTAAEALRLAKATKAM